MSWQILLVVIQIYLSLFLLLWKLQLGKSMATQIDDYISQPPSQLVWLYD